MIKDITQIGNKPVSFIKEFINNCTIEEKIDTHYVIVEITSKQTITIKKATGKVVDGHAWSETGRTMYVQASSLLSGYYDTTVILAYRERY